MKAAIALILVASASAGILEHEHIATMPMYQFKQDCGTKTRLHFKPTAPAFLQHDNVPGAGILSKDFKAFETVLKDGFMQVSCIKDYMYYRGDKFGDNKHDYKLGPVSDVSIVHYEDHVAKEDQAEMTQKVCFEFCRTVPNMGFFGIVNGRGCYCTPYFQAMESDSSQCDAVCEGDNTLMCGGKSKSSVFSMHFCASTAEDISNKGEAGRQLVASLRTQSAAAKTLSSGLQKAGEDMQKVFGAVGDSGMTSHAQASKVFAGKLEHKSEDVDKVADKIESLSNEGGALRDFGKPEIVTKAERIMEDLDETMAKGELVSDELEKLIALADPPGSKAGAAKQYYSVMYFVDKKFEDVPSTCAGDMVAQPMIGSQDDCASACDAHIHDCVGYQYFQGACALLSNFKTGFYYTGCGNFLQSKKKAAPFTAACFAKVSKFEGTTLKPDGSGKCKQCFNKLTKANRCFAAP